MKLSLSLPVLATFNIFDTGISYVLIGMYGIAYESNPIVTRVFDIDPTGTGFVIIKLLLSVLLVIYWFKVKKIPRFINLICLVGVMGYSVMILHGVVALISIPC